MILLTLASLISLPCYRALCGEGVLVVLSNLNGYADHLEGGRFTRSGNSGAGTGPFMGNGFEFAKGACQSLDADMTDNRRWRFQTLGCSRQLLDSDWCARVKSDPYVQYTLHFISWTIGPEGPGQRCQGRCQETGNKTAYIRTRVK